MTTLRDRIAAIVADGCEKAAARKTDAILALLRDEAPPSDEELTAANWEAAGGQHAMRGALEAGHFDEALRMARAGNLALYGLGHARGLASGEAEREELQRRLEESESGRGLDAELARDMRTAWGQALERAAAAERERDAAREELREVGARFSAWLEEWKYNHTEKEFDELRAIAALLAARKAGAP
jgi:hypothetical protein